VAVPRGVLVLAVLQAYQFLCGWLLKTRALQDQWCVMDVLPAWAVAWTLLLVATVLEGSYRFVREAATRHREQVASLTAVHAHTVETVTAERDALRRTLAEIREWSGEGHAVSMRALHAVADGYRQSYEIVENNRVVETWTRDRIRRLPLDERRKLLDGNQGLRRWFEAPERTT
jgi:hypothetical protein